MRILRQKGGLRMKRNRTDKSTVTKSRYPAAKKLKERRKACNLSQTQLGDVCCISVQTVSKYEQGYNDINSACAQTIYRMAQALNCNVEDILETDYIVLYNGTDK